MPENRQTVKIIDRILRASQPRISIIPNVKMITIGNKIRDGTNTGERALKFHVTRKLEVSHSDRIPSHLDDKTGMHRIATDVVERVRRPELFGLSSGDKIRAFDGDVGACTIAFQKNGRNYGITNAHVVRRYEQGGIAGKLDWNAPTGEWIGAVGIPIAASMLSHDEVNVRDEAVFSLPKLPIDENFIRVADRHIESLDILRSNYSPYWFSSMGKITLLSSPEKSVSPLAIEIDGREALFANFYVLDLLEGIARPGISGALICRTTGGVTIGCGLIFGGFRDESVFAFHFPPILERVRAGLP